MDIEEDFLQQIKNFFNKIQSLLFDTNFWKVGICLLLISLLQNGIWYSPQTGIIVAISRSIFSNPYMNQPLVQWLIPSFLGPLLGSALSLNHSIWIYGILHLIVFVIIFSFLLVIIKNRHGDFIARTVMIVFFLSPVSNVLMTWLGSPDILTVLLSIIVVVFWKNIFVIFLASFLLAINHPDQGFIILILITIYLSYSTSLKKSSLFLVISMVPFFLGRILIEWHFSNNRFNLYFSRLDFIVENGIEKYVNIFFSNFPVMLFSFYNLVSIYILIFLLFFRKVNRRIIWAFLIFNILAFVPTFLSLDQTRIFSILTFPAVLLLILSLEYKNLNHLGERIFKNTLTVIFLFGLILPRIIVWEGKIYSSAYGNIVTYLQEIIKN